MRLEMQLRKHQPPIRNTSQAATWSYQYIGRWSSKTECPHAVSTYVITYVIAYDITYAITYAIAYVIAYIIACVIAYLIAYLISYVIIYFIMCVNAYLFYLPYYIQFCIRNCIPLCLDSQFRDASPDAAQIVPTSNSECCSSFSLVLKV